MKIKRPKSREEMLRLERLTFDTRLQLRALPDGKLFDEEQAKAYAEAMEEGDQFPPLEVVEEIVAKNKVPVYWVISGFTRGGAYKLRGVASVKCVIYPGTFKDAEFYALSENTKHGQHRAPGDSRRAFDRLIDTPHLLERCREMARATGGGKGLLGALCHAVGITDKTASSYLKSRGLHVRAGKLATIPPEEREQSNDQDNSSETPTNSSAGQNDGEKAEGDTETVDTPEPQTQSQTSAGPQITPSAPIVAPTDPRDIAAGHLDMLAHHLASAYREFEAFVGSGMHREHLRLTAQRGQVPITAHEREIMPPMGSGPTAIPKLKTTYTWPVLAALIQATNNAKALMHGSSEAA